MTIHFNVSLKDFNTFGVDVNTQTLIILENEKDFFNKELFNHLTESKHVILGGGSNILFTKDFPGCVVLVKNKGKKVLRDNDKYVEIEISAGEEWDNFVKWSVDKNLMGLQNLALIPGTVGATPIQNVGAYNTEVKDFITKVNIVNLQNGKEQILSNKDCEFKYRDSVFKHGLKNKALIKSVTFKIPKFKGKMDEKYLQYSGIKEKIDAKDVSPLSLYWAIVNIREEKLPKVQEYGSCGSTFKNPQISKKEYQRLLNIFPQLPMYETENTNLVKIPAAYILEKLGWKNKRVGNVGTWKYHPLIVTNYGYAKAEDVLSFIRDIQKDFKSNTGIDLECEINIV